MNLMDYSLFVGVHHRAQHTVVAPEPEEPQQEVVEARPFDDIYNLEMRFMRRYPIAACSTDSIDVDNKIDAVCDCFSLPPSLSPFVCVCV